MEYLSAGVFSNEIDFSSYVGQISTTSVGIVGGASKGPLNVPTLLTSPSKAVEIFGEPLTDDYGLITALMYLRSGNQCYYIRVGNEKSTEVTGKDTSSTEIPVLATAKKVIGYFTETTEETTPGKDGGDPVTKNVTSYYPITLKGHFHGTYYNSVSYKVKGYNTTAKSLTLEVYFRNSLKESFKVSLDKDSSKFIGKISSNYISVEIGDKVSSAPTDVKVLADNNDLIPLEGGSDGCKPTVDTILGRIASYNNDIDAIEYTYEPKGLQLFTNPNAIDFNVICIPGRAEKDIVSAVVELCETTRQDCFAIIDPPFNLTVEEVIKYHNGEASDETEGTHYVLDEPLTSNYAAMYYPWVKVKNIYSGDYNWLPPSAAALYVFSNSDSQAKVWSAPAGLNRAMIPFVVEAERTLTKAEMDKLYGEGSAINPIINYRQLGFTIWGQKTLQRETTALDRINVRRLLIYIRKSVSLSSAYFVFERNDELTWQCWKGTVRPIFEEAKNGGGIVDYKIVMDANTVTQEDIENNRMPGRMYIKPTKTSEFIPLDFVITNQGAEFGE